MNRDEIVISNVTSILDDLSVFINNKKSFIEEDDYFNKKSYLNLFTNQTEFQLILNVIEIVQGVESLNIFKTNYILYAIEDLKKKMPNKDYTFETYENGEFMGILVKTIIEGGFTAIGIVDIFNKKVLRLGNEEMINIQTNLEELDYKLKELSVEEDKYILAKKNRYYLADGNPIEMIKMSVKKKDYEKDIENKLKRIQADKNYIYTEIGRKKADMSNLALFDNKLKAYQDELIEDLSKLYNIEELEQNHDLLDTSSLSNNENTDEIIEFFE